MRTTILLSLLFLPFSFIFGGNPVSVKQILETPLPSVWASVEEVYIWEEDVFKEYKIKKSPANEALTKFAKESTTCNYLYDAEGNRTPLFVTYFIGSHWNIKEIYINPDADDDIYYITIWREMLDDLGQFVPRSAGRIQASVTHKLGEKDGIAKPMLYYYTGKVKDSFFGKQEEFKRYRITFNKNKTKVFLHESFFFK